MCATCGCEASTAATMTNLRTGVSTEIAPLAGEEAMHEHVHADGTRHSHAHGHEDHRHDHVHSHRDGSHVAIEARILAKNDAVAVVNRAWLRGREILALNLVSSPGSGKTTLLERTIADLSGELPVFVIEGDQATAKDGERIREAGAPVVQINTGAGCHLDAEMVRRGLAELKPAAGAVLFIENVGNLVCPARFDLGEHAKVVLFSVAEGEDKPLKYPHMFQAAELVLINKTDLLPHLDFSLEEALANVARVNPRARTLTLSARTGDGLQAWIDWIKQSASRAHELALP
ncbi:MAG: hydrogenase nickel incorporation protein HypB [Hyphomicrobiales bacterium]|nr:hydrogenase nickel incorporation protein HypB [Hyphomicrobiales bacterium]